MSTTHYEGSPVILPPSVDRKLLVVRGRSGLLTEDLDRLVVENQRRFGRNPDDYLSIVFTHQNVNSAARILGIREETRRRLLVVLGEEEVEFVEAKASVRNIWVGEHVRLYAPHEAARRDYAGRNALEWATLSGQTPEMVVHANNGYFYPAAANDIILTGKTDWEVYPIKRRTPDFDLNPKPRQ